MKKVIVLALLAGAALGGAYPAWKWYEAREAVSDAERSVTTAYGNVDIRRVSLAFRVDGRLQQVAFEEGDTVTEAALVATLDPEPFEEEVALREAELASALANLQRFEAGYRPQEIETSRAAVAEQEAALATLQAEFERREALVGNGSVSRQSFDDIRSRRDEVQARLQSAREELALRREGYRQEDIAQARAKVDSQRAQLDIAKTRLADTKLYAPSPGTVLTRVLEPGSIARMGETVMTVSVKEPIWVRAYIPEPDLGRIHPGMNALVYTDSQPEHPYHGQVGFISPEAEFTPKSVETPDLRTRLVYRFRVIVENPDAGLRQGMPVTVKLDNPMAPTQESASPRETGA